MIKHYNSQQRIDFSIIEYGQVKKQKITITKREFMKIKHSNCFFILINKAQQCVLNMMKEQKLKTKL